MTTTTLLDTDRLLRHSDWLHRLARSLVRDEAEAADLVQETWLTSLHHAPQERDRGRAWLGAVLRNHARSRARRERRRRQREELREVASEPPTPQQVCDHERARHAVVQEVLALDEPFRSTVLQCFWSNASTREIARRSGCAEATVRSRLKRAKQTLKGRLDESFSREGRDWRAAVLPLCLPHPRTSPGARSLLPAAITLAASLLFLLTVPPFLMGSSRSSIETVEAPTAAQPPPASPLHDAPPLELVPWSEPLEPLQTPLAAERLLPEGAAEPSPDPAAADDETSKVPIEQSEAKAEEDIAFVRGRCVDAETGQPLAGVSVLLHGWPRNSGRTAAYGRPDWKDPVPVLSDTDGRFEIRYPPHPSLQYGLNLDRSGWVRRSHRFSDTHAGDVESLGDIRFTQGHSLEGRVVDSRGRPVTRVSVGVAQLPLPVLPSRAAQRTLYASTDADGRFRFDARLPAGTWPLTLHSATHDARLLGPRRVRIGGAQEEAIEVRARVGRRRPAPSQGAPARLGDLDLRVRVAGSDQPVERFAIRLTRRGETADIFTHRGPHPEGCLNLQDLERGAWELIVDPLDPDLMMTRARKVVVREDENPLDIQIERGEALDILVVDQGGRPMEGSQVQLVAGRLVQPVGDERAFNFVSLDRAVHASFELPREVSRATTDAAGRAQVFFPAGDEPLLAVVSGSDHARRIEPHVPRRPRSGRLRLEVDAHNVVAGLVPPEVVRSYPELCVSLHPRGQRRDGRPFVEPISLGPDGGFRFAALPAGPYELSLIASYSTPRSCGFPWSEVRLEPALELELRGEPIHLPPLDLRYRAVAARLQLLRYGSPLADCVVRLAPRLEHRDRAVLGEWTTDRDGCIEIPSLPPGPYVVTAEPIDPTHEAEIHGWKGTFASGRPLDVRPGPAHEEKIEMRQRRLQLRFDLPPGVRGSDLFVSVRQDFFAQALELEGNRAELSAVFPGTYRLVCERFRFEPDEFEVEDGDGKSTVEVIVRR